MIKFSVLLQTYNRHELLPRALSSLLRQTYEQFEVLVLDNGSYPPVEPIVDGFADDRIRLIRFEENAPHGDTAETFLRSMDGTHFLFHGDDDALVPSAFDAVKDLLLSHGKIELLSVGLAFYDHVQKSAIFDSFSGKIYSYDGVESALSYLSAWGIGPKRKFVGPPRSHPSGCFLSKRLIDKTIARQGEIFVRPFGDVGYLGCCFNTPRIYYLDLPLSIIGECGSRDSHGMRPGQRQRLNSYAKFLEYSPLRGISFVNLAIESHLKAVFRNALHCLYDCRLRTDIFLRHLEQVMSDMPWTVTTVQDIMETVPHLLKSIMRDRNSKAIYREFRALAKFLLVVSRRKLWVERSSCESRDFFQTFEELQHFESIVEFGEWLDRNLVDPLRQGR